MKIVHRLFGLPLVYLGVALLCVGYVFGWTNWNVFLIASWLLILLGIVGYVVSAKRRSKY